MNTFISRLSPLMFAMAGIACMPGCKLTPVYPPCPVITGITPAAARYDDTVTIKGKDFLAGLPQLYRVSIASRQITPIDVPDANTIRFRVPRGAGSGSLAVTLADGTLCSSGTAIQFTYQLTISNVKQFASGFDKPAGMDVDASGNVIVADKNSHVIKLVSPLGVATIIAGQNKLAGGNNVGENNTDGLLAKFRSPDDVAVDKQGNIFVADNANNCIRKISFIANRTVTTAAGLCAVTGGTIDGTTSTARFTSPTGVAVNKDNNVLSVEYTLHKLRYVNIGSSTVLTIINGMPALNFPNRLVYSDKRNAQFPVLVADKLNKRILEVNENGTGSTSPIQLPVSLLPHDLAVDESGNVIVLNREGKSVSVIYKDNSIVEIIRSTTALELKTPAGLAIDTVNKIIYISDDTTNTIISARYE